jgi:hypothetical protein
MHAEAIRFPAGLEDQAVELTKLETLVLAAIADFLARVG